MPHHSTKRTLEVTHWCNTCSRMTQHHVSDGRLGFCKEHQPKSKPIKDQSKQTNLFEV
jgi:hypothetical protein